MKFRVAPLFLMILLLTPLIVAAQATNTNPCTGATGNIGKCVSQIYLWSLGLSGLLAVAMSVFGGYLVMTARGNGEQASRGKSFIYSSLVGLFLLMGAYLLLNTINTDLVDFNVDPSALDAPPAQTGAPRQ